MNEAPLSGDEVDGRRRERRRLGARAEPRLAVAAVGLWLTGLLIAPQLAAQQASVAARQSLPPLVYVCPMPADAAVAEEKPGACPVCGMTLVATRLDAKWWCPTHQTLVVRDAAGKCPLDGKPLVQVTLAEHWTCAESPDQKLLEPGSCAGGQARKIVYELRAHGDHNPHHDGQFFMAADQWHHLEGTYPRAGLVRVFFYDNFTKPMPVKGFSGSLIALDSNDKEIRALPLAPSRNGQTLDAVIPAALARLPLKVAAKIRFDAKTAAQRFDFNFAVFSKDVPGATATATALKPPPAPAGSKTAASTAVPVASPTVSPASGSSAATSGTSAATAPAPLILDSPLTIPPALAEALDETSLPQSPTQLLSVLESRAKDIGALVSDGSLAQVWIPAMGTKTVALVLERRALGLPEAQRRLVGEAVKRIVVAAWELDNFGDLGDREKISQAYQHLATAVTDLKGVYEPQ